MTNFKDRERAEEAKYALDEETAFKVAARRNKLLGHWAAEKMDLTAEETDSYAKAVVQRVSLRGKPGLTTYTLFRAARKFHT